MTELTINDSKPTNITYGIPSSDMTKGIDWV